tara:strand:+ start:157 stop:705 length:549 start_codon:yes stop_codon:yes gene_type:complete
MDLVIFGDLILERYQAPLIEKYGFTKILSGLKKTIGEKKLIAFFEGLLVRIRNISKDKNSFTRLFGDLLFDHFHEKIKSNSISEISYSKKFSIESNFSHTQFSLLIQSNIINGELVFQRHPALNNNAYNPTILNLSVREQQSNQYALINYNLRYSLRIEKERSLIEEQLMKDLNSKGGFIKF